MGIDRQSKATRAVAPLHPTTAAKSAATSTRGEIRHVGSCVLPPRISGRELNPSSMSETVYLYSIFSTYSQTTLRAHRHEPMTGAQRSYLKTLSEEAKVDFDETLTKAQASERIDELQAKTGRGK